MQSVNARFYQDNAPQLIEQYNSASFKDIHNWWFERFESHASEFGLSNHILEIGAGSGRDAQYLDGLGYDVCAVEPCKAFREHGKGLGGGVRWIDSSLPKLDALDGFGSYDLVLLSAVWMHIQPEYREASLRKVAGLLKTGGWAVIFVRNGEFTDGRVGYHTDPTEMRFLAARHGFTLISGNHPNPSDEFQRAGVTWDSYILQKV